MPETKTAKRTTAKKSKPGFTAEERAAMKERARELKAQANREEGERDALAKIAEMPDSDRIMAEKVHAIVTKTAPELAPRTWYGMPAYTKDDKLVCHFKPAAKFKNRYATLGFSDNTNLDDGNVWPVEFALKKLTAGDEKRIAALVKKAVS